MSAIDESKPQRSRFVFVYAGDLDGVTDDPEEGSNPRRHPQHHAGVEEVVDANLLPGELTLRGFQLTGQVHEKPAKTGVGCTTQGVPPLHAPGVALLALLHRPARQRAECQFWMRLERALLKRRRHECIDLADLRENRKSLARQPAVTSLFPPRL